MRMPVGPAQASPSAEALQTHSSRAIQPGRGLRTLARSRFSMTIMRPR